MGVGLRNWFRSGGEGGNASKLGVYQGAEINMNSKVFGGGIRANTVPVSFVFGSGGVGDYINWWSAMEYVRAEEPHVDGRIYTSELFRHAAEWLAKDWPRWKVLPAEKFNATYERGSQVAFPKPGTQLINACGGHLMDIGFAYFCCLMPNTTAILPYKFLRSIDYQGPWKWPELDPESDYAVFTPCATSGVREMPAHGFDAIVEHTIKSGVVPVFLGKRELSSKYVSKINGYNMSSGIDLRERTNLLEATQVMKKAKFVIGLDNGLLHMAGTTNVPVIFGMNVTTLEHRNLRRKNGLTINLTIDDKRLPCIGCQSKLRFIQNHDFRNCFYKDYEDRNKKCLDLMFEKGSVEWKKAIDYALEKGPKYREVEKTLDWIY